MDLTNLNDLKSLLGKYHIRLTKKLGQHFLISREVLKKIITAADLQAGDTVLEIGPGVGTLTCELAKKAKQVVAVEKDRKLIKPLQSVLKNFFNIEIVNQDFLTYNLHPTSYKLIGDIPYNITGEIIRKVLTVQNKPSLIVLLIQREVGERIAAPPGKMSLISIAAQLYSNPEIIDLVKPEVFFPPPEVESVILKMKVLKSPRLNVDEEKFFRLARIGFSARRKTLLNNLSGGFKIPKNEIIKLMHKAGIKENSRAQELSMEEWGRLYEAAQIFNF